MAYKITNYTKQQAKKLGVSVKPSSVKGKKIHDAKMIDISSGISSLDIYILNFYMTLKGEK